VQLFYIWGSVPITDVIIYRTGKTYHILLRRFNLKIMLLSFYFVRIMKGCFSTGDS